MSYVASTMCLAPPTCLVKAPWLWHTRKITKKIKNQKVEKKKKANFCQKEKKNPPLNIGTANRKRNLQQRNLKPEQAC